MRVLDHGALEAHLRARRDAGRKLLVPYVVGGLEGWTEVVEAIVAAGADAVEVGIPFSDPVMDGPVIQQASVQALVAGTTPSSVIDGISRLDVGVPIVVMTYVNLFAHAGFDRMARTLADAGVAGAILPDLPIDEAGEWMREARAAHVDAVQLVAPTTPDDRLHEIAAAARGFVYAVGLLGVTGEREELAASAVAIARRCREATTTPVLVGVGISTPGQAHAVCDTADGVVVGSALVRRVLAGEGPDGAAAFVEEMRRGIDEPRERP